MGKFFKRSGALFAILGVGRIISIAFRALDNHNLFLKLFDERITRHAKRVKLIIFYDLVL